MTLGAPRFNETGSTIKDNLCNVVPQQSQEICSFAPGREVEHNDGEAVPAGQAQRAPPVEGPEAGQPREAQEKL